MTPERRIILLALADVVKERKARCDGALDSLVTILQTPDDFTARELSWAQSQAKAALAELEEALAAIEMGAVLDNPVSPYPPLPGEDPDQHIRRLCGERRPGDP